MKANVRSVSGKEGSIDELQGGNQTKKKGKNAMWINMTTAKMTEAYEKEGVPILYSPHNMQIMTSSKGFIDGYALFLYGDHTQGCSLTIWETRQDAEAFFTSPAYAAMVGGIRQYIVEKPVRQGWEVTLDVRQVAKGEALERR
jgi:heme-degrading monooxygenase HmoA